MKTTHCNPLFAPASIAVVGGGNDPAKPGGRVVLNLRQHGFPVLWVVNPKGGEIQGLPTFRTIDDLPEAPDLATSGEARSHPQSRSIAAARVSLSGASPCSDR